MPHKRGTGRNPASKNEIDIEKGIKHLRDEELKQLLEHINFLRNYTSYSIYWSVYLEYHLMYQ